jgi:hypothetical protein
MMVVVMALVGVLLAGGLAAFVMLRASSSAHHSSSSRDDDAPPSRADGTDAPRTANTPATARQASPPTTSSGASLFEEPSSLGKAVEAELGRDAELKQISIHEHHAMVIARGKSGELVQLLYRGGKLREFGTPPPLIGNQRRDLDKLLFDLKKVNFRVLPNVAAKAPKRLGWQGAEVSHIMVQHGAPFADKLLIRVYVKSSDHSGRVEYDLSGREHRVYR